MQETDRAFGLANPSLAAGLTNVSFFSSPIPFINVFKQIGDLQRSDGAWNGQFTDSNGNVQQFDYSRLERDGFLDDDGYLLRLPAGSVTFLSLFNEIPAEANVGGRYVFRYEGDGDFRLFGGQIVEQSAGRIVVDIESGNPFGIAISGINENNHLRNFELVREEHEAIYDAGAIFNPDYIAEIADFRVLRFMDWMHTNNSNIREFSDLADVDQAFYGLPSNQALETEIAGLLPNFISNQELGTLPRGFVTPVYLDPTTREPLRDPVTNELVIYPPSDGPFVAGIQTGVPLEIMIALANQTGVDPWFNIPHAATDDFVRQFAAYIRDNLDPRLNVYIEYSNEVWNSGFDQFHYVNQEGLDFFGERSAAGDDFGDQFGAFPANAYYGYRTAEILSTFHEVFGADAGRINGVLSSQTFNPFVLASAIQGAEYYLELNEPTVALDELVDSVGVTGYFGSDIILGSTIGGSLVNLIAASRQAFSNGTTSSEFELFNTQLADFYRDGTLFTGANPELATELHFNLQDLLVQFQTHVDVIGGDRLFGRPRGEAYDIDLVQYEGGPAIVPVTGDPDLRSYLLQFVRSEQLAAVLTESLALFRGVGGTLANDFHVVGRPSFSANFGTRLFLGDANPQSDAFLDYNANAEAQFGSVETGRDPTAFLHGLTQLGTAANDTLFGTNEEDFLAGGAGNDLIEGGLGADGLNGEDGDDYIDAGGGDDTVIGGDGNDTLLGGNGFDYLDGGKGNDSIDGGSGDDTIFSGEGADILFGGIGDDELRSGSNLDTVFGGDGNDTIIAQSGSDVLDGGNGNDFISGGAGFDTISGGAGNDTLNGGVGADSINGDSGNDQIDGGTNNDRLFGGQGDDTITGGSGFDFIDGGDDDDVILGMAGFDTLFGGNGNDFILGGMGGDWIDGGAGNDTIDSGTNNDTVLGGAGDDTIAADSGADYVDGGDGNDLINGGAGNDTLIGSTGNDTLRGGATGADRLFGGDGNDNLFGESNNDTLDGGAGDDTLRGGSGGDVFVFANGFGVDTIVDFANAQTNEFIDLSAVSNIINFADLTANHLSSDGQGNAVITDGVNSITLLGVAAGDLVAGDFIF